MMRQGVREYILKPVERDKLREILEKLDAEITHREESEKKTKHAGEQLLRYLLTDANASEKELESIEKRLLDEVGDSFYVIASNKNEDFAESICRKIVLSDLSGMQVYIVSEDELNAKASKESFAAGSYAGISAKHCMAEQLRIAYIEAVAGRKKAFCIEQPLGAALALADGNDGIHVNENLIENAKKLSDKAAVSARVQLLGTDNRETIEKDWTGFFTAVKKGQIGFEDFERAIADFWSEFENVYKINEEISNELKSPYSYDKSTDYQSAFMKFIHEQNEKLVSRNNSGQSDEKIRLAIKYINENYNKDLNMAVVSNEVSMNYSLFSSAFKEYTGTNYVDYIKKLRMDEAKKLLSETDLRVNEIASKVGYDNEKHFMKSFKACVGVSPGEYRKNVTG